MQRLGTVVTNKTQFLLNKYFTGHTMTYKQMFAMIIPIFVDMAFIVIMSIMNTAMISSSGVAAVSAVSSVDTLNIFIMSVFIAIATGGTVIVAQYKGSGNQEMVSRTAAQSISTVTLISLLISLFVIIFNTSTLQLLFGSAEAEVLHNAKIFLIGNCISFPFLGLYQAITGVLRGVADTKACLVLSIILNATYFFLNIILITIFDFGVIGLTVSLIIARVIGAVASFIYLLKYDHTLRFKVKDALKLNYSIIRKMMYIGLPFAAEQMFFNGGKILTQTFIVQFGTLAMTINAISNSIAMLFQMVGNALAVAIVTIVGQCIGRNDIPDARKFIRSLHGLSAVSFLLMAAIIIPFFPMIVNLFSPPAEIVPTIYILMVMLAIAHPLVWSISFMMPSALRAAGDSKFTSITSLLTMWLFRIILGYILGVTLGYGIIGIWIAMVAEWAVRGVIFTWRYKGDKWYKHKLI
ncbi:MAG: MATE family efflux transporter [Candidatus Cohnella colombiensis]|uniref:Probable multidrug resistance protein NorM n=1 Tax=Candidatus Cohnella colombiensis TaxID=3121368 RepID=A0AA95EVJ0_9BACL|nr:MAG: MATE family efflux transporter [Cohnella sp.]